MIDRPTRFQRGPIADPEKTKRDARDLEDSHVELQKQVASLLGTGTPLIVDEGFVSDAVTAGIIS